MPWTSAEGLYRDDPYVGYGAAGLILSVLLAACASTGPLGAAATIGAGGSQAPVETAQNPAQAGLSGFLAMASNGVVFLQWTQSGDAVSGSLTQVTEAGTQIRHLNANFTGVINNSSVTLTFPEGLGISTSWTGSLSGSQLTLSFPATNGTLSTLTFDPGSVADYNAAVAQIQIQVGAAASQAAAAQQLQEDQGAIDADARVVASDLQALPSDVASLQIDLAHVPTDLNSEQGDVNPTQKDEQAVLVEAQQYPDGNSGGVCTDAAGVATDAAGVQTDESGSETDGAGLSTDIAGIQNDEDHLQKDLQTLEQVKETKGTYRFASSDPEAPVAL